MTDRWKGLSDAEHARWEGYVRDLGDALLLRDWELDLSRENAGNENWASIKVSDVENQATLRFGLEWGQHAPEEQREFLVHELMHVHADRPARVMAQLAEQWSENSACQFAREAHRKETEILVNTLARLLAPTLPLPPEAPS